MAEKQQGFRANATALSIAMIRFAEQFKLPTISAILLGIRVWLACLFWHSGLTKIANWDTTVFLFAEEYKVPVLSPEMAAFFGTGAELLAPLMLLLGLGTRLAALVLLLMTAVIQLTYLSHITHLYWAVGCVILMVLGSGMMGWDYRIRKKNMNDVEEPCALGKIIAPLSLLALTLLVLNEVGASIIGIEALEPQLKMITDMFKIKMP